MQPKLVILLTRSSHDIHVLERTAGYPNSLEIKYANCDTGEAAGDQPVNCARLLCFVRMTDRVDRNTKHVTDAITQCADIHKHGLVAVGTHTRWSPPEIALDTSKLPAKVRAWNYTTSEGYFRFVSAMCKRLADGQVVDKDFDVLFAGLQSRAKLKLSERLGAIHHEISGEFWNVLLTLEALRRCENAAKCREAVARIWEGSDPRGCMEKAIRSVYNYNTIYVDTIEQIKDGVRYLFSHREAEIESAWEAIKRFLPQGGNSRTRAVARILNALVQPGGLDCLRRNMDRFSLEDWLSELGAVVAELRSIVAIEEELSYERQSKLTVPQQQTY